MRLVVVGCAGSYPAPDAACAAYLVQAEDADGRTWTVLLDLGNGALGPLQRYADPTALDAIGISHLHADHVADMVVLNVLRRYRPAADRSRPCRCTARRGPPSGWPSWPARTRRPTAATSSTCGCGTRPHR